MATINWGNASGLESKPYKCGYCGNSVASKEGYYANNNGISFGYIYICHFCLKPTFFDRRGNQTPGVTLGEDIEGIDDKNVEDLYNEARNCTGAGAYTAAVLCCRKLLMHIAVAKGADQGKKFIEYIEYLASKNYIPPGATDWVDQIRQKGNEANHEIIIMNKEAAEDLLSFSGMLLKIIYEFPSKIKKPPTTT